MIPENPHRAHPFSARMTAGLMPALALAVMCLWNSPAAADFRLCNNTSSRVGIALGYKDAEGWTTEGWWNVSSRSLRDPAARHAGRTVLLHLRARLRPRRRVVGTGLHVLARQGIHHQGHRELPGARFRPHRLLRGRHRRAARLDRATDRIQRTAAGAAGAGNSGNGRSGRAPEFRAFPGESPGLPNPPGGTPPGASGLPPAAAPGSKP